MTRKYGPMKTAKITWTLEELTVLVNDEKSHVHLVKTSRHIALHPYQLGNLKQSLHDILGDQLNYYDVKLNGLLLSYKNPKLLSENAAMLYDSFACHVDIQADFYVFRPKVGYILKGVVNKKAANHLGVLVHKAFNVSIPRKDEEAEDWQGNYLNVGDEVTFAVELMELKPERGKLPFFRGKLVTSDQSDEDVESEGTKDENEHEISRIDMKQPKFSSTVNEEDSSESEEDTVESPKTESIRVGPKENDNTMSEFGKLKKIQAEDSDDSDDAVPFSNRSNKKESPKKILESSRKIQEEKLIKKSPLPEKTSKKSLRDLHQNSHDSDSDVPIFNKNTRNMEKESNLVKLHRTRNSDDDVPFSKHKADRKIEKASKSKKIAKKANSSDDSDEVPCNSKPVIQSTKKIKRQRSESEISVTQPSKRLKKSQRSESDHDNFEKTKRINGKAKSNEDHNELSGSNSNVDLKPRIIHEQLLHNKKTEVNPQKHSKKRNSKPAHDMSSDSDSEIEKANRQIKKEKDLQTKDDNCSHTARLLPDNSDNESNGIKNNSNKNWSDLMDETVDSDDDFASFMLAQKIEKEPDSEMKRKGDEDVEEDSIQMLLHAQHIKSEAEKSTRPKVEHQEVNDSNIFKINKEKKKKKSKKQEGEPKVKIKKEKEKTVSASNEQSSSMLPPKASKRKQLRSSALTSPEDSGEVSDACSTKSRILVKREESVFFTNITIKQEPYSSDVESISSRKRVRTESAKLSIERNDTFENIRIKPEPSDGKSEPHEKTNKIKKEKFMNDPSIKSEEDYSDGAPPKKKSKKKFSE